MRISIHGYHIQVTDELREYTERKLEPLERIFGNIKEARVEHTVQRNWHICQVNVDGDGFFMRAEEQRGDMYQAVDAVVEKLERQARKFKGKTIGRHRGIQTPSAPEAAAQFAGEAGDDLAAGPDAPVATIPAPANGGDNNEEEPLPSIVRTKRFPIELMAAEEAALQMEMLNHDFFVFLNSETDQVNVVYRRRDGNYGLIEPEL